MGKSRDAARRTLERELTGVLDLALHTAEPGFADGMSAFEVAYPGYERRRLRALRIVDDADGVRAELDELLRFAPLLAAGERRITHWSIGEGEQRRYTGALEEPIVLRLNHRPEFEPGDIVIEER